MTKAEMHVIAYCYHWSNESLWSLPRNERKMWVEIIKEQKNAENRETESGHSSSTYKESH
jgi:hypothetical protein